ncbi:MAG: TIM barrel protein [Gemmatimonadota bacterium]
MNRSLSRRDFLGVVAGGLACARAGVASPPARKLLVGHTGITWGYAPANAERAIADVGSLGYHAFESFGSVLEYWDQRGGLKRLLEQANLPLRSAYCPFELTDSAKRAATLAAATRWGKLIRAAGGSVAVIGPNNVTRSTFDMRANQTQIVATLNDIGRALADTGVIGALHPHSGSCIETRDDVYAVMEAVDTSIVKLAPDVGELMAGGADPLPIIRDFLPLIRHAHLKDYNGGATNDGYCPLGHGRVDIAGVVNLLETAPNDLMLMVELNPSSGSQATAPLETARLSKTHLETLGYRFR